MKKKLIMAAAIAFAVFAIPYGSNALSTVSVASENNTVVATPTPKPVEEVKNAVEAIDVDKITDRDSAFDAYATLAQIGRNDLKNTMNADQDTINDIAAIEAAYAKMYGYETTKIENTGSSIEAVGVVGAAFWSDKTTLSVKEAESDPAINSTMYAVTSSPVYVNISLTSYGQEVNNTLIIPVSVTIKTPAGVDGNKAVIFHFVGGNLEEIKPIYNASANTLTFTVDHFSTFAIAEAEAKETDNGSDSDDNSGNTTGTTGTAASGNAAFEQYRENLANTIANAKDGATIKITRDQNINALPNDIMQALYKKQTVALELEYTFQGNEYTVTIPAGKAEDNEIAWYGPLYLQMRYGK